MFSKRPNKEESEDDILRQQEEFLKQNSQKSANQSSTKQAVVEKKNISEKPKLIKDNHDIVNLNLNIVERDVVIDAKYTMAYTAKNELNNDDKGFPVAQSITLNNNVAMKSTRGPSLYAQKFLNQTVSQNVKNSTAAESSSFAKSEYWKKDIVDLKNENTRIIENMSREEIDELRSELLKKLNPKTVEFLKSKKFKYRSEVMKEREIDMFKAKNVENLEKKTLKKEEEEEEVMITEDKFAIPIEEINAKKYLHMNIIEKDKLSWLGNIPEKRLKTDSNKYDGEINFSARFNFEGDLVDIEKMEQIDVHEGLHHHGEEPERPGYTINELFMYLQSSLSSQKQIGLKVFEKIISKAYRGYYDACFNENLIEYLLKDTPLILVVRTCLDDTSDTVWKSTISTMKAIICNTIYDEIFLDRGYLIFEDYLNFGYKINLSLKPILDKDVEFDEQVLDQQYSMYDLVECLLMRTTILERFAYLINNHLTSCDVPFVEDMFDILIRIARHSKELSQTILEHPDLVDVIFLKLIDKRVLSSDCNLVHSKVFKLLRVCVSSILSDTDTILPTTLVKLFNKFNKISFIDTLNFCLILNPEDVTSPDAARIMLKVCIESVRLWLKLLSVVRQGFRHPFLENLKNNFSEIFPSLLKILNFCKNLVPIECEPESKRSTFDYQFASCVCMLVKMYHEILDLSDQYKKVYCFDLYDIAMKWFVVIHNHCIVPDFDTNICILVLTEFILNHLQLQENFINITIVKLMSENQRFIRKLFELCVKNSNTNSVNNEQVSGTIRDSSNLPSFGSIYFKGFSTVPLFNSDSPIFLLQSIVRIALNVNISLSDRLKNLQTFEHLSQYIKLVSTNLKKDFTASIFDLIEVNVVSQSCVVIQNAIEQKLFKTNELVSNSVLSFVLMINKLNCNLIKADLIDKTLFSSSLFGSLDKKYYTYNFDSIKNVYQKYSNFDTNYWIFDPLVKQVSINEGNSVEQSELEQDEMYPINKQTIQLEELKSCLEFIELVYDTFPEYFLKIDIANNILFEMVSSVFIVSDDHFFNCDIQQILERFLIKLMKQSPIVCSKQDTLPYYGNVVDFFTKLVNQFDNCSYGDRIFSNYLLVFFQPICAPYFRKHFFSEHLHLIRNVNLRFSDMIISMESLLFPLESDLETLEIYLKTLLCDCFNANQSPIFYCQLIHHLNHVLFRENSLFKHKLFNQMEQNNNQSKLTFEKLIRSVQASKNDSLRTHLTNYLYFDDKCEFGLQLQQH